MESKKRKNIKIAEQVWNLYLEENTMASIARKLAIHRTEVSYIIKYTTAQMYLDSNKIKCFYKELFNLRDLKKRAIRINKSLKYRLQEAEKPWWEKLF